MSEFITTEAIAENKQDSLQKAWDAVKTVFSERESIGYWHYPLFLKVENQLKCPDILICDRYLGLIIIDVLEVDIEQVKSFNEDNLESENYAYNPLGIVQKYVEIIRANTNKEDIINNKITGRSLLLFANISSEQWQEKGLNGLENGSSLIFNNQLSKVALRERIEQASPYIVCQNIENDQEWNAFLNIIAGNYIFKTEHHQIDNNNNNQKRAKVLGQAQIYRWDAQQEWIGKSIPQGVQRVRGIAGSGKTVLLCQKAALMHLKHPDWHIGFVFFTRSLYDQIIDLISKWINHFSNGEIKYSPESSNLKVLHAWGSRNQEGLYSYICKAHQQKIGKVKDTKHKSPTRGLADLCKQFLSKNKIKPLFEAILIDEGQDLVTDSDVKYEDKQAIYWLAYQSLKPVNAKNLEQKRLIWAYDEAQSLSTLVVPETKEILGEKLSQLLGGESGGIYPGGARKAYDMPCCYRTPAPILNFAYAIGLGLLRPEGFIKKGRMRKADLESIGYEVEGDFRTTNTPITIKRPSYNTPNPIPELWGESVLNFNIYNSRQEELTGLLTKLQDNLTKDGLNISRDILIIALGNTSPPNNEGKQLQIDIANFLLEHGINIYIPTALTPNETNPKYPHQNPDLFWDVTGRGVTISTISRAKGNEAYLVYILGLDNIAKNERDFSLRNQLFVALTRAKAWVELSGIGAYPFYDEIQQVINSGDSFTFTIKP